jgi:predicted DNA-binding protein with PD1-like motif
LLEGGDGGFVRSFSMIIMQSHESRRFMGRLDLDSDIINSFRDICHRHKIFCGKISAMGYFKSVRILNFSVKKMEVLSSERIEGPFMAPFIEGNISQKDDELFFNIFTVLAKVDARQAEGIPFCAKLIGGEVISCEFTIFSFDDLRLMRGHDSKTGLEEWLFAHYAKELEAKRQKVPSLIKQESQKKTYEKEDEKSEELIRSIKLGDYVNHHKFGICQIVQILSDDKIRVQLPTNKLLELSLGVMLFHDYYEKGNKKVFNIEVRKKK